MTKGGGDAALHATYFFLPVHCCGSTRRARVARSWTWIPLIVTGIPLIVTGIPLIVTGIPLIGSD